MRNYSLFFILTIALHCLSLKADTLSSALIGSDGVISGHVEEQLVNGVVIKASRWVGDLPSYDYRFRILHEADAKFEVGEHVVIMVKLKDGVIKLHEHDLNKFTVRRVGATRIIVNNNSKIDPLERQYKLNSFFKIVEAVKQQKFLVAKEDYQDLLTKKKHQLNYQKKKPKAGRGIASVTTKPQANSNHMSALWLLLILGLLGTVVKTFYKKL